MLEKYSYRYHRAKSEAVVMRVIGRGHRFEFYKKAKRLLVSSKTRYPYQDKVQHGYRSPDPNKFSAPHCR